MIKWKEYLSSKFFTINYNGDFILLLLHVLEIFLFPLFSCKSWLLEKQNQELIALISKAWK